ncbi:MarR family transcriptional regulator [Couchioplanes caeruleus]|uniref:MarR family winged helix-turn-helix transcriptional regulator n=1 Tax=Couchioplanes caeruleus TaxID=56438 RepID=UPI00201C943C|nr:MarR family transcriptional regulator [Couchioplanes caeruleus]UQU62028.1 MarR family transcriptional regulator [Couchioplanes caeruleus]
MSASEDPVRVAEELRSAMGDFVRHVREHDTMPRSQTAVLGHLDRAGALSIAELARRERVRHQSMTRTVGLLAEQGLVTLGPGEADRRQVVVTVTPEGVRRLDAERRHRAGFIAAALDTLNGEERAVVARIPAVLRKLMGD